MDFVVLIRKEQEVKAAQALEEVKLGNAGVPRLLPIEMNNPYDSEGDEFDESDESGESDESDESAEESRGLNDILASRENTSLSVYSIDEENEQSGNNIRGNSHRSLTSEPENASDISRRRSIVMRPNPVANAVFAPEIRQHFISDSSPREAIQSNGSIPDVPPNPNGNINLFLCFMIN
jgi:hypothetical protein